MKQVILINSMVSYSNVGILAQIPVFHLNHIEVLALPSGLYSTNLGIPGVIVKSSSNWLKDAYCHYQNQHISIDGICVGMVHAKEALYELKEFIKEHLSALKVLDPVFADHGKYYKGFDEGDVSLLKEMIPYFDLITPNMSEAQFLMNEYPTTLSEWKTLLLKMWESFHTRIIITGIKLETDDHCLYVLSIDQDGCMKSKSVSIMPDYSGAGDVFSASVCANMVQGKTLEAAIDNTILLVDRLFYESVKQKRPSNMGLIPVQMMEK